MTVDVELLKAANHWRGNQTMTIEFELDDALLSRWKAYQEEAPAWSLQGLIAQLLRQHFDEADTMRESIQKQEAERGR